MNNACPECGKTYAVSAEHVGRKVTCKQCHKKLVVGPDGLELAGAAPPAEEGGAFGFGGGGGGYTPAYSPPPPPSGGGYAAKSDDGYGGDAPRRPRSGLGEYLTFRRFIVPLLIQIIFWIMVLIAIGGGVLTFGAGLMAGRMQEILVGAAACVIGIPLGILFARIYCELLILGFRLLDSMNEIRDLLENKPR